MCVLYAGMNGMTPGDQAYDGSSDGRQTTAIPAECRRYKEILRGTARRLSAFHARFWGFFTSRTRNAVEQSRKYLFGLIQSEKRNMERMAEVVPDINDQSYSPPKRKKTFLWHIVTGVWKSLPGTMEHRLE